jgi:MFS family permease
VTSPSRSVGARPASPAAPVTPERVERAKRAVAVVFGLNGFVFASWIARLPAVRDLLGVGPGELGLLLLLVAVGSVSTLLAAGVIVHRLGPRRSCLLATVAMTTGLAIAAFTPPIPVMSVGLVLAGAGTGLLDVAMNVEGAGVERLLGRPVMPRYHAGFSLGTVAGAAGGAAAAALSIPVRWHLAVLAAGTLAGVALAVRSYLGPQVWGWDEPTGSDPAAGEQPARGGSGVLRAWREPRTLLIGAVVLGMAFAEGTANDWLALGLVDGYRIDHALAACGYGLFVAAMTTARMVGPWTLSRFGRVAALRGGAAAVGIGVVAVAAGPLLVDVAGRPAALVLAGFGAFAWGIGAALGFPIGISAASDDPRSASARVSVVSTIAYTAFLAGPPVLGLIADRVGVVHALLAVSLPVVLGLLCASAARELPRTPAAM